MLIWILMEISEFEKDHTLQHCLKTFFFKFPENEENKTFLLFFFLGIQNYYYNYFFGIQNYYYNYFLVIENYNSGVCRMAVIEFRQTMKGIYISIYYTYIYDIFFSLCTPYINITFVHTRTHIQ